MNIKIKLTKQEGNLTTQHKNQDLKTLQPCLVKAPENACIGTIYCEPPTGGRTSVYSLTHIDMVPNKKGIDKCGTKYDKNHFYTDWNGLLRGIKIEGITLHIVCIKTFDLSKCSLRKTLTNVVLCSKHNSITVKMDESTHSQSAKRSCSESNKLSNHTGAKDRQHYAIH